MSAIDSYLSHFIDDLGWPLLGLVRLALAVLCGGLVGLEREVRGRQAGFRTNVLVCVGCAVVMLVSVRMAYVDFPDDGHVRVDPSRIAYGVMSGIGFLGAGVIVRYNATVRGLTTAAGIWCVAAIGLACGMGLYVFAVMATVTAVSVLWGMDYFERLLPRRHYRSVVVRRRWDDQCVTKTVHALRRAGYKVTDWSFERFGDLRRVEITVTVGFSSKHHFDNLQEDLPADAEAEVVAVREG